MAAINKIGPVRTVLLHWSAAVREAHATALEKKKSWSYGISKLTCHPTKHILSQCTMATFLSTEQDDTKSQRGKRLGRHKFQTIEVKAASYSERASNR